MTIFGDGSQTRAFTHIDDVAPIIASVVEQPKAWNDVFNVGADDAWTLNDLARKVAAAMGVEPRITYLPQRYEARHARSSHEKISRVFGRRETTSLDAGLQAMAAWVKRQGARSSQTFSAIEIEKNLPAVWLGK
jgi:UDP-glucose 4-epimerase